MKTDLLHTLAIVFAAGIILVGILAILEPQGDAGTISVSGEATRSISPEEAIITFSVVTEDGDANTAREENARRAQQLVSTLQEFGVVETANFFVSPVYEPWGSQERDPSIQLYRVSNTVTVTMRNLELVGEAIDAGSTAGANQVQNVQFVLTQETREQVRTELLAQAAQNARQKADSLASGLDVRIKGVHSVSESSVSFPIYARAEAMDATPIEAEDLEVSASVQVEYALR